MPSVASKSTRATWSAVTAGCEIRGDAIFDSGPDFPISSKRSYLQPKVDFKYQEAQLTLVQKGENDLSSKPILAHWEPCPQNRKHIFGRPSAAERLRGPPSEFLIFSARAEAEFATKKLFHSN
jgi:hypothetical protein